MASTVSYIIPAQIILVTAGIFLLGGGISAAVVTDDLRKSSLYNSNSLDPNIKSAYDTGIATSVIFFVLAVLAFVGFGALFLAY